MKISFGFAAISACGVLLDKPSAKRNFVRCTKFLRQRGS